MNSERFPILEQNRENLPENAEEITAEDLSIIRETFSDTGARAHKPTADKISY